MTTLKSTIEGLAAQFAQHVIEALRGVSIEELVGASSRGGGAAGLTRARSGQGANHAPSRVGSGPRRRGKGGRLARRSVDQIAGMVESIADLLQRKPDGLRAEQIRDALGVDAKELPRPLADGIKTGRLSKTGQKRATTYFLGGSSGSSAKRGAKRTRGRKKRG